jgi:hypothetical protein
MGTVLGFLEAFRIFREPLDLHWVANSAKTDRDRKTTLRWAVYISDRAVETG